MKSLGVSAQNLFSVPNYDLFSYGTGVETTFTAEVVVYLSEPNKNVDSSLRKAAIHGVIFKGIAKGESGNAQRPMAKASAATEYADFFILFFADGGQYQNYVSVVDGTLRVEKVEKKLYRIRAIVSIQKDSLRELLEEQDIVESFNNLF